MKPTTRQIIQQNKERLKQHAEEAQFCPYKGDPNDLTRKLTHIEWEESEVYLPKSMLDDPDFPRIKSEIDYKRLRHRHDFPYWCATCVTIRHKTTGQIVPFVLNTPQRRVVTVLEEERLANRPIRLIMLKARQWGGSTLIQMYFAWIQTVHRLNWNSLICAHVKETAAAIRGMFDNMLRNYPEELWQGDEPPKFVPFQRSSNTLEIVGRGSKVTLSSSFGQNSVRGLDFSMAHLSEVAFWNDTDRMSPGDFLRSVCGGIPTAPYSMIVMESTANGVCNFFHNEWLRAEDHKNAYRPIFVPWYEIDIYQAEVPNPEHFIESFDEYETALWKKGLTLEQIYWYRLKRSDMWSTEAMFAEFPTTPEEAFTHTGSSVFHSSDIERLRSECTDPIDLSTINLPAELRPILDAPAGDGILKVWNLPKRTSRPFRNRYVISVDVGGRSHSSDWSVISVFDRMPDDQLIPGARIEVVAQWRGHCDHHLLAEYAAKLGNAYHKALIIIESNSLESATEGPSQYILESLNAEYRNLYSRVIRDRHGSSPVDSRVGFHTNRTTKGAAISCLIEMVRNNRYIEHDNDLCDELSTFELTESGTYSARRGFHDDILMTRAIALYVISGLRSPIPPPDIHTLPQSPYFPPDSSFFF